MKTTLKPFQWPGGKGNLLRFLAPLVPYGLSYCEPYAGSAALFFVRRPCEVEVLNDMDGRIINFFRVLQNDKTRMELKKRLRYTPYARAEYTIGLTAQYSTDPVESAWGFFVVANMSKVGSSRNNKPSNFGYSRMENITRSYVKRVDILDSFAERLKHAIIESIDGIDCLKRYDTERTVFYVDPPYALSARRKLIYEHEVNNEYHEALVDVLISLRGAVVLSGYHIPAYDRLIEAGWEKRDFQTFCHIADKTTSRSKRARIESVYRNPLAVKMTEDGLC